jgi:hypothetical protein
MSPLERNKKANVVLRLLQIAPAPEIEATPIRASLGRMPSLRWTDRFR